MERQSVILALTIRANPAAAKQAEVSICGPPIYKERFAQDPAGPIPVNLQPKKCATIGNFGVSFCGVSAEDEALAVVLFSRRQIFFMFSGSLAGVQAQFSVQNRGEEPSSPRFLFFTS